MPAGGGRIELVRRTSYAETPIAAPTDGLLGSAPRWGARTGRRAQGQTLTKLMMNQEQRPFRVLGVQQIAVGAPDRQELRKLWVDLFGFSSKGTFRSESENVDEEILGLGLGEFALEVDLMQPLDPSKKPRVDTPALNHIGLWIDDLATAVLWLESQGVRFAPGGIRKGASGFDVCFIHPRGSEAFPVGGGGVLIELVQAPAELVASSTQKD